MIEATIIADSISEEEYRLTTIECTFHRFILPEINTYRMWSRSAQSSRAIPLNKRITEVKENPAIPVYWGKNQRGMVAEEELSYEQQVEAESVWVEAANAAADYATYLQQMNLHKQTAARILEPYLWQTNVISSVDWNNMFRQRIHPDAQPEFKVLAEKIKEELENSTPTLVQQKEWHLPYISDEERNSYDIETLKKVSVARVAKTSYGNQGGWDVEKDLQLEERLFNAEPKHYAPYEMIATPAGMFAPKGNLLGWRQLRHMIEV
jgi:thymidylate synthase ThyX